MVTAMSIIENDKSLQDHWIKRFIALIIDSIILWVIASVVTFFVLLGTLNLDIPFLWSGFVPFFSGIMLFIYAFIMEASPGGATIGKKIMDMRVISTDGPMTAGKAAIRNISKIYWLFLFLDWLIGFVSEGDPKQRFMDRHAGTTVILTTALNDQQQHTYQSQQASYAPPPQEEYQRHEQTYQYPPPPPTTAPAPQQAKPGAPSQQDATEQVCNSCGGRMSMTGSGRLQCIRCGKIQ